MLNHSPAGDNGGALFFCSNAWLRHSLNLWGYEAYQVFADPESTEAGVYWRVSPGVLDRIKTGPAYLVVCSQQIDEAHDLYLQLRSKNHLLVLVIVECQPDPARQARSVLGAVRGRSRGFVLAVNGDIHQTAIAAGFPSVGLPDAVDYPWTLKACSVGLVSIVFRAQCPDRSAIQTAIAVCQDAGVPHRLVGVTDLDGFDEENLMLAMSVQPGKRRVLTCA